MSVSLPRCSATAASCRVPFSEHPVLIFCSTGHRFAKRRSIRTAELQGRGSWSAKRVRRRAGRVRISGTQIRTYAHVVCLAERQEMRMVRVFYEVIAGRTTAGKIRAA
jgi:hypothetical protein